MSGAMLDDLTPPVPLPVVQPIRLIEDPDAFTEALDPAALILTCANCGAAMDERKCKLICRCGSRPPARDGPLG